MYSEYLLFVPELKAKIYGVGLSIHGLNNHFTCSEMKSSDK